MNSKSILIPVLFSIFIWFSICVELSMLRYNSISLGMCMDDAKNSIFFGKWIPSNQNLIRSYKLIYNIFPNLLGRGTEEAERGAPKNVGLE